VDVGVRRGHDPILARRALGVARDQKNSGPRVRGRDGYGSSSSCPPLRLRVGNGRHHRCGSRVVSVSGALAGRGLLGLCRDHGRGLDDRLWTARHVRKNAKSRSAGVILTEYSRDDPWRPPSMSSRVSVGTCSSHAENVSPTYLWNSRLRSLREVFNSRIVDSDTKTELTILLGTCHC
jgi:hypothetical protein